MRHGLLTTRLRNFRPGASNFSLTAEEVELLGLASGLDAPLSSRPLAEERVWVTPAAQHVFRDSDAQYRMHIDQLMPTWKIFIFLEPVTLERGPFHYVRGSHAASLRKLRWLFERTNVSSDKRAECSPRHVARSQWCSSSPECLRRVFRAQQHDLKRHGFHATEPPSPSTRAPSSSPTPPASTPAASGPPGSGARSWARCRRSTARSRASPSSRFRAARSSPTGSRGG